MTLDEAFDPILDHIERHAWPEPRPELQGFASEVEALVRQWEALDLPPDMDRAERIVDYLKGRVVDPSSVAQNAGTIAAFVFMLSGWYDAPETVL